MPKRKRDANADRFGEGPTNTTELATEAKTRRAAYDDALKRLRADSELTEVQRNEQIAAEHFQLVTTLDALERGWEKHLTAGDPDRIEQLRRAFAHPPLPSELCV